MIDNPTQGNDMKLFDDNRAIAAAYDAIHAEDPQTTRTALADLRRLLKFGEFEATITTATAVPGRGRLATIAYLHDGINALGRAKASGNKQEAEKIIDMILRAVSEAASRGVPGYMVET
jgi:hypothetical protein